MNPIEPLAVSRKVLEQQKFGAAMAASVHAEVAHDVVLNMLMYRMSAMVLSDKIADDTYTETRDFPRSAWHTWKAKHRNGWPRWVRWLTRPVKCRRFTMTVNVPRCLLYPEAALSLPELGRPVVFEQTSTQLKWWDR